MNVFASPSKPNTVLVYTRITSQLPLKGMHKWCMFNGEPEIFNLITLVTSRVLRCIKFSCINKLYKYFVYVSCIFKHEFTCIFVHSRFMQFCSSQVSVLVPYNCENYIVQYTKAHLSSE